MIDAMKYVFLDLGSDAVVRFEHQFKTALPDIETLDLFMVAEITVNGEKKLCSFASIESVKNHMNIDIATTKRSIEMCEKFVEAYKDKQS